METFLGARGTGAPPALGLWSTLSEPLVLEAMAAAGPDYVCIDMQHGTATEAQLVSLVQAVAVGGSTPVVRVPDLRPAAIMKALDAGAHGIIVPLVETAEEAARVVAACRYPPYGSRSFGPFRASLVQATSDPRALERVAAVVMVETGRGIENLEAIVATEGVTAVYLGPSDLSLALGLPPGSVDAPEFRALVERVLALCARHGVVAGMHCYDGAGASRAIAQGFGMVTVAADLGSLRQAVAAELATARRPVAG